MYNSFCALIGVVVDNNEEIRTDIQRPVVTMVLFSESDRRWNTFVKVIVEKNEDIKKAQNIQEGDIVLVIGVPSYMDGIGYCVYANNVIFLSKNKQEVPLPYRKAMALEYEKNDNLVQIVGKVCSVQGDKLYAIVKRKSLLRGEVAMHDTVPLYMNSRVDLKEGDNINFIGVFTQNKIIGTAIKIDLEDVESEECNRSSADDI